MCYISASTGNYDRHLQRNVYGKTAQGYSSRFSRRSRVEHNQTHLSSWIIMLLLDVALTYFLTIKLN